MAQNNIYLNNMLGNSYNSGTVQIDVPIIKGTEERKKAGRSPVKEVDIDIDENGSKILPNMNETIAMSRLGYSQSYAKRSKKYVRDDDAFYYVVSDVGYRGIRAFCTEDVTFSMGNEWGSILPALQTVTRLSQWGNEGNVVTWLSGTKGAWSGSKPLTFPLTFYVFSWSPSWNALKIIEPMIEFVGISESTGGWIDTDFLGMGIKASGVHVHGGYHVNPFENNQNYIETSKTPQSNNMTFRVHLGNQITIDNLLLGDIQVTHSNIQVESGVPLYVKVQANFRTVGVPTVYDIKRWYGVS